MHDGANGVESRFSWVECARRGGPLKKGEDGKIKRREISKMKEWLTWRRLRIGGVGFLMAGLLLAAPLAAQAAEQRVRFTIPACMS